MDTQQILKEIAARSRPGDLFQRDEHAWIAKQVSLISEGKYGAVDFDHIVEVLLEMTVRDQRELQSRLRILIAHMLKVHAQPSKISRSWIKTILDQQADIAALVDQIPSLESKLPEILPNAYRLAVRLASAETGIAQTQFSPSLPWTYAELIQYEPPRRPEPTTSRVKRKT